MVFYPKSIPEDLLQERLEAFDKAAYVWRRRELFELYKSKTDNLAPYIITGYEYDWQWWKEFVGHDFIGQAHYHVDEHNRPFIFSVYPVKRCAEGIFTGKAISFSCLELYLP